MRLRLGVLLSGRENVSAGWDDGRYEIRTLGALPALGVRIAIRSIWPDIVTIYCFLNLCGMVKCFA